MEAVAVFPIGAEVVCVNTVDAGLELRRILDGRYTNSYGKRVMEFGFGVETLMSFLEEKFGEKVCHMDLDDWNERNRKLDERLVQGVPQCLPIAKDSVDVVVSANIFEEELDLVRALAEIERVLIRGGEALLIISAKYFEDGRLKLPTALDMVESSVIVSPTGEGGFRVITFKKK
jgi:SAM-dependent methyltransferase